MDREYDLFLRDVRRQVTTHMPSFRNREFLNIIGGYPALNRPDFMTPRALNYLKEHVPEVLETERTQTFNGKTTRFVRDPDIRRQTMGFQWSITRNGDNKVLEQGRSPDREEAETAFSQARYRTRAMREDQLERVPPTREFIPYAERGRGPGIRQREQTRTAPEHEAARPSVPPRDRAKNGWELAAKQNERPSSSPEWEAFKRAIAPAAGRQSSQPERANKERKAFRPKSREAEQAPSKQPDPSKPLPVVEMGDYKYQIEKYELGGSPTASWDVWKSGAEPGRDKHLDSGSAPSVSEAEREAQRRIRQFERGESGREGPPEKTDKPKKREPYRPKHRGRGGTQRGGRGLGDDLER